MGMRLKLLACKVLEHELCSLLSSCINHIDVTFIRQDLHDTPQLLNKILQEEIDRIDGGESDAEPFDAIVLGYGLCSNATTGLRSLKHKLVIPKAHDCITFLLGSREKYNQVFGSNPGTYWYSKGWIENARLPSRERFEEIRREYIETYGEENAQYLMEMEHSWVKDYNTAGFIWWNGVMADDARKFTKKSAASLKWDFRAYKGSPAFLSDLLNACWDSKYFLVLEPGTTASQSFDEEVIKGG